MFLDDENKIHDLFILNKNDFLNSYSYLCEEDYDETINKLWELLSDVCIDEKECILEDFYIWNKGTFREEIWKWFDDRIDGGIGNKYFN